jgi:peptidoglycan/xylan/chitin deacetylase (PgdA/CDA1 family)
VSDSRVVILNYHRIVPDGAETGFYDVSLSKFRAQMELLAQRRVDMTHCALNLHGSLTTYVTFDDGTDDHVMVGELLSELGLRGVFFVISGLLDTPGRLTSAQVRHLSATGNLIGSHTVSHPRLPQVSDDVLRAELLDSRTALESIVGVPVDWLAPPGGYFDSRVLNAAADAGYEVVRTMEWGYAEFPLHGRVPTLPVLPSYTQAGFIRLIEGHAPLWRYQIKRLLKQALSEDRYVALRDAAGRIARRGGG